MKIILSRTLAITLLLGLFCISQATYAEAASRNISSAEAARMLKTPLPDQTILDVRTSAEFAMGHLPGARNMDFFGSNFEEELMKLDRGKPYIIYCRTGNRSGGAIELMEKMGFKDINHMSDGIQQWRKEEHPIEH